SVPNSASMKPGSSLGRAGSDPRPGPTAVAPAGATQASAITSVNAPTPIGRRAHPTPPGAHGGLGTITHRIPGTARQYREWRRGRPHELLARVRPRLGSVAAKSEPPRSPALPRIHHLPIGAPGFEPGVS